MEAIVINEQTLMRAPPSVSYTTQSKWAECACA